MRIPAFAQRCVVEKKQFLQIGALLFPFQNSHAGRGRHLTSVRFTLQQAFDVPMFLRSPWGRLREFARDASEASSIN